MSRTKVSVVAEQLLEDLINGKQTYNRKLGSQIEKEILAPVFEENKTGLKTWLLLIAFCFVGIYYGIEYSKNKVTGFAVNETGDLLSDSKVVFYCVENEEQHTCKTDEKGNFNTRLPTGKYKFWVKDHGSLETSKVTVTVDGESNYRVTSFKK
jgi:hypothetical protein